MPEHSNITELKPNRFHEAYGNGGVAFALIMAAKQPKPVAWIGDTRSIFDPSLLTDFIDPARVTVLQSHLQDERLWSMEETLRSGAFGFVICETSKPMTLTEGRRLQLAAEAGATTGIALNSSEKGSNAAETRWHCVALPAGFSTSNNYDSTLWRWSIKKNKSGTLLRWNLEYHAPSRTLSVLPEPADQSAGSKGEP